MNRLVLAIAMLAIMVGPASAQNFNRVAPDSQNARTVGGEVKFDGTVVLGTGFTAHRIATGRYRIVFQQYLFVNNCPILTVTPVAVGGFPAIAEVLQRSTCDRAFHVRFWNASNEQAQDSTFQFVAVGAQP
jgi:hypothetical protein